MKRYARWWASSPRAGSAGRAFTRRLCAGSLAALVVVVRLPPAAASPVPVPAASPPAVALLPVPYPALDGLEPAVATQLREVRATLESAARGDPGAAALYGEAGRRYHAYGLTVAAQACYRNAEALAQADFRWPYLLGLLHEQDSRLDDAARAFSRSLDGPDQYYPAFVRLATVELQRGRLDAAVAALEPARRHAPDDPALLAVLGQIALAQGRHEDAVRDLSAALERQPKAARLHYPLGMAQRALGRLDQARAHLERAGSIGVQPRDPLLEGVHALRRGESSQLIEGHAAHRAGDFTAAVAAYERAFEASGSTSVTALVNLAAAEAKLGRLDSALGHLEQARRLEPDAPTVLYNLGALLAHAGRPAEAAAPLQRLVTLAPQDDEARTELVLALLAAGRTAEALDALAPLKRVEPSRCAELLRRLGGAAAAADGPVAARAGAAREGLRAGGACAP